MKKITAFLVLALLAGTIVSCDSLFKDKDNDSEKDLPEKVTYRTVTKESRYSVELPSYMKEVDDLNDVASLQYQSEDETKYMIVIDEALEDYEGFFDEFTDYDPEDAFLDKYAALQMEDFHMNFDILAEEEYEEMKIGGYRALTKLIETQQDDIPAPMTIQLAFIEGKEHVYMVMIWAPRVMDDVFKEDRTRIMKSFREA